MVVRLRRLALPQKPSNPSSLGLPVPAFLATLGRLGPRAFDECKNRPDFLVREHAAKGGHIALVAIRRERGAYADFRDPEKLFVRVMPGVPCFVVGWRRQLAVRFAATPVRLALEPGAMARGAIFGIDGPTQRHLYGVREVRPTRRWFQPGKRDGGGDRDKRSSSDP